MDDCVEPVSHGDEGQTSCRHGHDRDHYHFLGRVDLMSFSFVVQHLILLRSQTEMTRIITREILRIDELNRNEHNESTRNIVR